MAIVARIPEDLPGPPLPPMPEVRPHKGWALYSWVERDWDGFYRLEYGAIDIEGRTRILHVHSWGFAWTQERFAWLVDHDFPRGGIGNWTEAAIDAEIAQEVRHAA